MIDELYDCYLDCATTTSPLYSKTYDDFIFTRIGDAFNTGNSYVHIDIIQWASDRNLNSFELSEDDFQIMLFELFA